MKSMPVGAKYSRKTKMTGPHLEARLGVALGPWEVESAENSQKNDTCLSRADSELPDDTS